jgi:formamidopyrimidine-DNA glycosylase
VPELPEVETIRRIVEGELADQTVSDVVVRLPKLLRTSPIPTLDPLVGQSLLAARRRAKVLLLEFTGNLTLMLHLKLAGQVAVVHADERRFVAGHPVPDPKGPLPHKSTHVEIHFESRSVLYVSDLRQFGWFRLMPSTAVEDALAEFKFGPEAVGPDSISVDRLSERLGRRSIPIKTALLDQSVLAGLGNIYVDEALHRARIHPMTTANTLSPKEFADLHEGIQWALEQGIAQGGAKIIHNRAYPVDGFPAVHGRQGETCPVCGTVIKKIRVGARGTYFCPVCQPAPNLVIPSEAEESRRSLRSVKEGLDSSTSSE